MEIALVLYMCSAIQKTCLDPYVWPDRFYDNYGCMVAGYEESGKKIAEIGQKKSTNTIFTSNLNVTNIR